MQRKSTLPPFLLGVAIFILSVMLLIDPETGADEVRILEGKAFSDPSFTFDMPEEWINQPITYDHWADDADLAITLDQHLYFALAPMIKEYARTQGIKIVMNEGTCGISGGLLSRKAVDMAGYCCPPADTDRLPDIRFHTIGIGAIAIFVHPDNQISDLTLKQAQSIYRGKVYRWSELRAKNGTKGPDVPIKPLARLHCKRRPGHWRLLLDDEDLFGPRTRTVGSIEDIMYSVYKHQGAFGGIESLYMAHYRYARDKKVKFLTIDGFSPEDESDVLTNRYPLYFTYNITTWEREDLKNSHSQSLVDYLLQRADKIEKKFGIIPSSRLRRAGWKFNMNELIGEPEQGKQ